jgi:hypothetical protein
MAAATIVRDIATKMDPGEGLSPEGLEQWTRYNEQIAVAAHQMVQLWADAVHRLQDGLRDAPGSDAGKG